MKYNNFKSKAGSCFLCLAIFICLSLLCACGSSKDTSADASDETYQSSSSDTGSVTFGVVWQDKTVNSTNTEIRSISTCNGNAITTVDAAIYSPEDKTTEIKSGSWNCDAGSGSLKEVPTGSNYTIIIEGKSANTVLYRGTKTGFAVNKGQNDAGIIVAAYVGPDTDPDVDDDGDGYTELDGDCDDGNASINPGATEICGDTIDQDCDGNDPACPATTLIWDQGNWDELNWN